MDVSERYRSIAGLCDVGDILRATAVTARRSARDVRGVLAPPSTDTETRLAELWREILGVDEVGIDDNFFELGGDSLHVTQVLARIESRFGCELPVDAFFDAPTVRQIAARLTPPDDADAEAEAEASG